MPGGPLPLAKPGAPGATDKQAIAKEQIDHIIMPAEIAHTQAIHYGLMFWVVQLGLLFLTLAGWTRMISTIINWYWLSFAGVAPGPLYLAVTGGLWGLAGLAAVIWLLLRRPWSSLIGTGVGLFFALTYWIDRLLVRVARGNEDNAVFAISLTLLCLIYLLLVLRPWKELPAWLKRTQK